MEFKKGAILQKTFESLDRGGEISQ